MKKSILMACGILMTAQLLGNPYHAAPQCIYKSVEDEELFLAPLIREELKQLAGKIVLDAGCGSGFWTIEAAKEGAHVCGFDQWIDTAQIAIAQAGVEEQIALSQGDLTSLPYENESFDHVLSVDTVSSIPATTHILTPGMCMTAGLGAYFREIYRVLKDEGRAIIVAPASYDIVFTDQSKNEREIFRHIHHVLSRLGRTQDPQTICEQLNDLIEVKRATFVHRDERLVLVADENELRMGELIWRKTPQGVFFSFYHPEEEYLTLLQDSGLKCVEIKRPCFNGKLKWDMFHSSLSENEIGLGSAYMNHNPFTFFYVEKVSHRDNL